MKRIALALLALALSATAALAQSLPPFSLTQGYVPTPAQWGLAFTNKQDYLGASPCIVTGCTITGPVTINNTLTVTGISQFAAGTAAAPGIASGVSGTGIYGGAAAAIGITVGGASKADYGLTNGGDWTFAATVDVQNFLFVGSTLDVALARNAAGVLEVDNGTAGTFRDLVVRNLTVNTASLTAGSNLTVNGDVNQAASSYHTWGAVDGTSGYGFRDNAGVMQVKNSGGAWSNIATAGGSNPCTTTPNSLQYDTAGNFGCVAGATSNGTTLTVANNDLILGGSSTGTTTISSANAGASNFTITVPAATDTLAVLGTAQTFSATETFSGQINASNIINSTNATDATSTSTGAIVTSGGIGIAKSLFVGTGEVGGTATGGNQGAGTVNVSSGYFVNGTKVATTTNVTFQTPAGSGTYTTPAGVRWIRVVAVGGGAGGGGTGGTTGPTGTAGGNTTFGTSLIVANGGSGGTGANTGVLASQGGAGGSASLGSGPLGTATTGSAGVNGLAFGSSNAVASGAGGSSCLGGAGQGAIVNGSTGVAGGAAGTSSGSGGGGAVTGPSINAGGGGAGGCVLAVITSPNATYAYAVGGSGAGGIGTGTNAATGGAGGAGIIVVEEHYNF